MFFASNAPISSINLDQLKLDYYGGLGKRKRSLGQGNLATENGRVRIGVRCPWRFLGPALFALSRDEHDPTQKTRLPEPKLA